MPSLRAVAPSSRETNRSRSSPSLRSPSSWALSREGGVQYLVHHAYEGKPKPWARTTSTGCQVPRHRVERRGQGAFSPSAARQTEEFTKRFSFSLLLRGRRRARRSAPRRCLTSSLPRRRRAAAHAVTCHAARRAELAGRIDTLCKQTNARDERRRERDALVRLEHVKITISFSHHHMSILRPDSTAPCARRRTL